MFLKKGFDKLMVSVPILPAPMTPNVFRAKPVPIKLVLSFHLPLLTRWSFCNNFPATAKIIVKAATATGLLTALGVLVTIIFFFFIASISTESKPTPNLEIIFNLQLESDTQLAFAFGKFKRIASNFDVISVSNSVIDLSIQDISISSLSFKRFNGSIPKHGSSRLFNKSPEIPTLNIILLHNFYYQNYFKIWEIDLDKIFISVPTAIILKPSLE